MDEQDTIIVVGHTEVDSFGNLWVTPQGGGERIKIAKKRENLHPIFQQGQAVLLSWQTYMNKPYVADAKPVSGELPPTQELKVQKQALLTTQDLFPEHQKEIERARQVVKSARVPSGDTSGKYKADPAKTDSIERQVAIKLACEIAPTEPLEHIFEKANRIYKWISQT